jgi:hypothetical protein
MSVDDSGTNAYGHSASPTLAQSDTLTDKSTATEPAATELHTHTQRERERERERVLLRAGSQKIAKATLCPLAKKIISEHLGKIHHLTLIILAPISPQNHSRTKAPTQGTHDSKSFALPRWG